MNHDLEALIAEFIERRENGESLSMTQFAADHPQHADELRAALADFAATDALFPADLDGDPTEIGRYRVLGALGAGGMGRVLRVEADGQQFALKLLHAAATLSPRARERLRREAVALQRLEHPGIVRVVETGLDSTAPHYVMELLEGPSLAALIEAARADATHPELPGEGPTAARAATLVADLAAAVQAAHDAGLLHRDLKPANVLLRNGRAVLCDFGLAGDEAGPTLTATGDLIGTPHYMAPEQARGEAATATTDVYGLGAILFELLTMSRPHEGDSSMRVMSAVRTQPLQPALLSREHIPGELAAITRRALAFAPSHRFRSAAELRRHLLAFADGKRLRGSRPSLRQRVAELCQVNRRAIAVAGMVLTASGVFALGSMQAARALDDEARGAAIERAVTARLVGSAAEVIEAGHALEAADSDDPLGTYLATRSNADRDPFIAGLATGDAALGTHDWDAAIAAYRDALGTRPQSLIAMVSLGHAARRAGDLDAAEHELESARRMLPSCAALLTELARTKRRLAKRTEARDLLAAAIATGTAAPDAYWRHARVCCELDEFAAALESIDIATERNQDPARVTRIQSIRASIYTGLGRREEALPIWRELVRDDPELITNQFNLAISLDSSHQLRQAAAAYRKVLDMAPDHVEALACLAWLHSGSDSSGCPDCRSAFERDPDLRNNSQATEYALETLRQDRGATRVTDTATQVLLRTGRSETGFALIDEMLDATDLDDHAFARLSRSARKLRK